jgi:hypothetical protein
VLFPAGYLPLLPGEILAKKIFGANFASKPDYHVILTSYPDFYLDWASYSVIVFLTAAVAFAALKLGWVRFRDNGMQGFSRSEWILIGVLACLPLYAGGASFLVHVYSARYVVSCMIGLAILTIALVAEAARREPLWGVLLSFLFLIFPTRHLLPTSVAGLEALMHPLLVHEQLQTRFQSEPWMRILEQSQLPIASDNHLGYDQIAFYADAGVKQRLNAVTNIRAMNEYPDTTVGQLLFLRAQKELSYRASDVSEFVTSNPHFLLVGGFGARVWMPGYLRAQQALGNASVACLGPDCVQLGIKIYDVQFKRMGPEGE